MRARVKPPNMATRRIWQQGVLTVYEELQSSDSEGEMNEKKCEGTEQQP